MHKIEKKKKLIRKSKWQAKTKNEKKKSLFAPFQCDFPSESHF